MALKPNTKIVRCCHCRGMMRVSARAMSVFCPHCQKRAPLESFRITGAHPGRTLSTCGDIHVEETASLNLDIIGTNVYINGRVRGAVTAAETLDIGPAGHVIGDVKAGRVVVQTGGVLEGRCEMTAPTRLRASATEPDHDAGGSPTTDGGGSRTSGSADASGLMPADSAFELRPSVQPRPLRLPGVSS